MTKPCDIAHENAARIHLRKATSGVTRRECLRLAASAGALALSKPSDTANHRR